MSKRDESKTDRQSSRSYSISHSIGGRSDLSESDAEKKRSKLGYQRISIACAHCRRRKIRCLLAEGDPESRCQNCIRLKKECIFYPVDQQAAMETPIPAHGKASAGKSRSSGGSASYSSPTPVTGRKREAHESGNIQPSSNSYHGLPIEPGSGLAAQGPYADTEYSYRAGLESQVPRYGPPQPHTQFLPPQSTAPMQAYWRTSDNRAPTHQYASYTSDSQLPSMIAAPQQPLGRADHGWQQQETPRPQALYQRNVSYGDAQSMAGSAFSYGAAAVQPETTPANVNMRYSSSSLDAQGMPISHGAVGQREVSTANQSINPIGSAQPYSMHHTHPGASTSVTPPVYPPQWYSGGSSSGHGAYPGRSA